MAALSEGVDDALASRERRVAVCDRGRLRSQRADRGESRRHSVFAVDATALDDAMFVRAVVRGARSAKNRSWPQLYSNPTLRVGSPAAEYGPETAQNCSRRLRRPLPAPSCRSHGRGGNADGKPWRSADNKKGGRDQGEGCRRVLGDLRRIRSTSSPIPRRSTRPTESGAVDGRSRSTRSTRRADRRGRGRAVRSGARRPRRDQLALAPTTELLARPIARPRRRCPKPR